MSEPLLQVDHLVRHYERPKRGLFAKRPKVQALKGVSFSVETGESFGIVGESGSGKSTLARAIMALEKPTSGHVRFMGKNMFDLSDDERRVMRRHIQMVYQDPFDSLDPKQTVRMIVTEPLDVMDDVDPEERDRLAKEVLASVDLETGDLDEPLRGFSGGQRQRIAIARALITKPDLIVADEPVSALDVSVQAQVLDLMMTLQERFGLTYIVISHDVSVIRQITDRLAVMEAGLIVEQGDTGDVLERPQHPYTKDLLDFRSDEPEEALLETGTRIESKSASDTAPPRNGTSNGKAREMVLPMKPEPNETPRKRAIQAAEHGQLSANGRSATVKIEAAPKQVPSKSREVTTPKSAPATRENPPPRPEKPLIVDTKAPSPTPPVAVAITPIEKTERTIAPKPRTPRQTTMIVARHLIDGRWKVAAKGGTIDVINPSDGQTIGRLARGTSEDVDQAVKAAHRAMAGPWGRVPAFERGRILANLSRLVLDRVDHLATLEARDVGKPLSQAKSDARALARYFEFYGGASDKIHGQTIPYQDGYTVLTLREPHGVTGHIVPWNYPMQIIGRSVGAALAMGNATVLKPGEDASLTALEIGRLALEAGLPPGALNIVTGLGEEAGNALAAHPGIDHLSFTGSVETGKLVQQAAAGHSCPVTLELGGKSPQIVFADADLDQALPFLVNAAIQNAGQTCSAGSRVLIQDWIYDELVHRLAERFRALNAGPAEQDLDCGPVINPIQKRRIEGFLNEARTDQVDILAEGAIIADAPDAGCYVKPTLLGGINPDHILAQEEIFGPVLTVIRFTNEDDAINIANNSAYGLVAGVWTKDGARQMRLARAIKTGQVFINNYGAGGGVELPFGGVKSSGFGREKGFEALYGFSTLKTIAMQHG